MEMSTIKVKVAEDGTVLMLTRWHLSYISTERTSGGRGG